MEKSMLIRIIGLIIGLFVIVVVCVSISLITFSKAEEKPKNEEKIQNIFDDAAEGRESSNVIVSPESIKTCLTLLYFGSSGATADEIRQVLGLDLKRNDSDIQSKYSAYKIYANSSLEINKNFKDFATNNFNSEMENIDFADRNKSLTVMNNWLQSKANSLNNTNFDLLNEQSLDKSTSVVILNAIYFSGKWQIPFHPALTKKAKFWITPKTSVMVNIMHDQHNYFYGNFKDINASAVELNYVDPNASMIIFLPNSLNGLKNLEENIQNIDILKYRNEMKLRNIEIFIPKFSAQFSLKLNEPLKKIGIRALFSESSDLSGVFNTNQSVRISKVYQKAFIEIHEYGSGNSMISSINLRHDIVPKISQDESKLVFNVNHPFLFLIRVDNSAYIIGHISKL